MELAGTAAAPGSTPGRLRPDESAGPGRRSAPGSAPGRYRSSRTTNPGTLRHAADVPGSGTQHVQRELRIGLIRALENDTRVICNEKIVLITLTGFF